MDTLTHEAPSVNPDRLAWLNDSPDNDLDSYPGPGWDDPGYEPTLEEEANLLGFELTLAGEDPAPPRGWNLGHLVAFYDGVYSAWVRQAREEREQLEYEAWLDELARDREAELERYAVGDYHEDERCRSLGCIESRKEMAS